MKWTFKPKVLPESDCSSSSLRDSSVLNMPTAHYVIGIANIMTLASLLLVIVAITTDYWLTVTVDRAGLQVLADKNPVLNHSLHSDPNYYSRNRGLFRTCYRLDDLSWIDTYEPRGLVTGKTCLRETGFEFEQDPRTIGYGKSYDDRKHLLRAHVGVQTSATLILALTATFGFIGCYDYNVSLMRTSAIMAFFGSFLMSSGMALFHGYDYLEKQKIEAHPFFKASSENVPLRDFSKLDYGFSYVVGWMATILSLVTAIMFLVSSHCIIVDRCRAAEDEEFRQYMECEKLRVPRNLAYDYIEYGYGAADDMADLPSRKMSMDKC